MRKQLQSCRDAVPTIQTHITDTRVRLASPVLSTLSGFPPRAVFKPIIGSSCRKISEYSGYCPYSFVTFLTLSISPHVPPERNPGHGHQIVADIPGRSINNSSVTFRTFINIASNYHSSPCIHVPNSSQSPDSVLRLGTPSPSNLTYSHK